MQRKSQKQFALVALFSLLILCSGCVTPRMNLYDGPQRDSAEIAALKIQWNLGEPSARIESIDGKSVQKGHAFAVNTKEVDLLPGEHTLEVSYFDGSVKSIDNAKLTFMCKAGGVYELHVAPIDEGFGKEIAVTAGGKGHWTAWIIDANTKEVMAGEARTTPLRWYEK